MGEGWDALVEDPASAEPVDAVARAFAHCFRDGAGATVLEHLRKVFLDRRVGPSASDAELRHVEGQRSVVAHILALIERGRRGAGHSSKERRDLP
jgi:3-oxoacyl-[acyl-carrier-protein] synthase III